MSSTKFTPGPWKVLQDDVSLSVLGSDEYQIAEFEYFTANNRTYEEEEANAQLTVSAPDLYAALEALVRVNEEWNAAVTKIVETPPKWNDSYLDAARTALAKARGEDA